MSRNRVFRQKTIIPSSWRTFPNCSIKKIPTKWSTNRHLLNILLRLSESGFRRTRLGGSEIGSIVSMFRMLKGMAMIQPIHHSSSETSIFVGTSMTLLIWRLFRKGWRMSSKNMLRVDISSLTEQNLTNCKMLKEWVSATWSTCSTKRQLKASIEHSSNDILSSTPSTVSTSAYRDLQARHSSHSSIRSSVSW